MFYCCLSDRGGDALSAKWTVRENPDLARASGSRDRGLRFGEHAPRIQQHGADWHPSWGLQPGLPDTQSLVGLQCLAITPRPPLRQPLEPQRAELGGDSVLAQSEPHWRRLQPGRVHQRLPWPGQGQRAEQERQGPLFFLFRSSPAALPPPALPAPPEHATALPRQPRPWHAGAWTVQGVGGRRRSLLTSLPGPPPPPLLPCLLTVPGSPASPTSTSPHLSLLRVSSFLCLVVFIVPGRLWRWGSERQGPQSNGSQEQPPTAEEDGLRWAWWQRRERWRSQPEHISHFSHFQRLSPLLLMKPPEISSPLWSVSCVLLL